MGSRTILVACMAAAASVFVIAGEQNKQLNFVSPVRPPFTEKIGQPRFALDLVEEALQRGGVTATTTIVHPSSYGSALLSGKFDGTAVGWRDSTREERFLLSEPYLENRLVLIARHGDDVSASNIGSLKGKRVAIIDGYAYGDHFRQSGPEFVGSQGEPESLRMLLDRKVDYVLMDELVVQYLLEMYPEQAQTQLQIGRMPMLIRPVSLQLRRGIPGAVSIINAFNRQITAMIADRTYHRLLHVEWIYADVDGDGLKEHIAAADQAGMIAPQRAYSLFTQDKLDEAVKTSERYFFGGAVYNGWSSVPDRYKVDHLNRPDSVHPTARIFTINWK